MTSTHRVFDLPETVRTRGRLLTVDRIIASSAEKAKIRQEHQADLIDMESSALALMARERLLRFLSVRVISDDASTDLPPEIASMLAHTGSYRVGAALRALWQRPGALKDFWTLHARAPRIGRSAGKLHQAVDRDSTRRRSIIRHPLDAGRSILTPARLTVEVSIAHLDRRHARYEV